MSLTLIFSFITASVILALMPGPENIYVLTESMTRGYKNGVLISIGLCSGILIHTTLAATGLSIVIQNSAIVFSIIKYLGAAYMAYLAISAAFEKELPIDSLEHKENLKPLQLIRKGFFMNVLNPKVSLFFIAFFPQFITPEGFSVPIQTMRMIPHCHTATQQNHIYNRNNYLQIKIIINFGYRRDDNFRSHFSFASIYNIQHDSHFGWKTL